MFDSDQGKKTYHDCVPDYTITDLRDLLTILGMSEQLALPDPVPRRGGAEGRPGADKYITTYIIRTMRSAPLTEYLERRRGLGCASARIILLLLKRSWWGRTALLADSPGTREFAQFRGLTLRDLSLFPTGTALQVYAEGVAGAPREY